MSSPLTPRPRAISPIFVVIWGMNLYRGKDINPNNKTLIRMLMCIITGLRKSWLKTPLSQISSHLCPKSPRANPAKSKPYTFMMRPSYIQQFRQELLTRGLATNTAMLIFVT